MISMPPCDVTGIVCMCVALAYCLYFYRRWGHRADSLSCALIGYLLGNDVILKREQFWSMRLYISDYSWCCVWGRVVCVNTCTRAFVCTSSCGSTEMLLLKAVVAAVQAFSKQMAKNTSQSRLQRVPVDKIIKPGNECKHNESPKCTSFT